MSQWYVKVLSKLTQVSVQTLHHYDRIGLLKPSVRLTNGYRLYSEKDLLTLQQIVALKFFGFQLSQIKTLLSSDVDIIDHFSVQSKFLEEKAKALFEASKTLKRIISDSRAEKSIPWETIIELMEAYHMTQQLEKTWAGKVLTPKELTDYAHFIRELNSRLTDNEKNAVEQQWEDIVALVHANLDKDPNRDFGIALGKRCMDWVNNYYGKQHVKLRNAIWKKGFKEGHIDDENALSPAGFTWLDSAINAYYESRTIAILNEVATQPHDVVLQQWEELLNDFHGDEQESKNAMFNIIMDNDKISKGAKTWLEAYIRGIQRNQ